MTELESVRLWLRNTYNIGVSDEWLTACLEWIQQEHQGLLPSVNALFPQVFQQWLLSDLSEIGEQVLPQNIVGEEKSELVGNYPLQLLSLVDVGFPLYGQKQKLQGRVNPNEEVSADKPFQPAWEPKPSRMLMIQLTDGHTHIQALEYKQIKDLHAELPSGLKVLVYGTVLCRRGVLMLTPDCVQVLGGEVDTLVEQNTPLAVLDREMTRNKEDEGKYAKTEFSGTFLSCGAKMLDDSQKYLKTESYGGPPSCDRMSRTGLQLVKPEPRGLASSSLSHLSFKQETELVVPKVQYSEQEFKQEDDMNYDDCFSDDLDLQEIDALENASAAFREVGTGEMKPLNTGFQRSYTATSFVGSCEGGQSQPWSQLQNVASTSSDIRLSTYSNHSTSNSFTSNPDPPTNLLNADDDFEAFDDDFEIDEFSDNIPESDNSKSMGLAFPGVVEQNTFTSAAESKFAPNPAASSLERNSQSTFPQTAQPLNRVIQQKPHKTAYSVPSKSLQSDPPTKNIFKVKSSPTKRAENLDASAKMSAKKQVKLSDMFASSSVKNPKLMSLNNDRTVIDSGPVADSRHRFDDDCCIIDDGHTTEVSSQKQDITLSSNSSSKFVTTSSSGPLTSDSRPVPMPCPNTARDWPQTKVEQEFSSLSEGVIYPTPSPAGFLNSDGRSPFQYLSNGTNLQPPTSMTVKAYISTLTDKLSMNGGANWSLACRINDGTASLDVDLADKVLAELIGFSAKDSIIMRQKVKTEPRVKDVLMEGLSKCQQKLINMSCLMEVDFVSALRRPVVRKLIPVSCQHVLELLTRVEQQLSL